MWSRDWGLIGKSDNLVELLNCVFKIGVPKNLIFLEIADYSALLFAARINFAVITTVSIYLDSEVKNHDLPASPNIKTMVQ